MHGCLCGRFHVTGHDGDDHLDEVHFPRKGPRTGDRLRRRGLRPIQIWVPDVRSRSLAREARRQSRLVATSRFERAEHAFLEAISEWTAE